MSLSLIPVDIHELLDENLLSANFIPTKVSMHEMAYTISNQESMTTLGTVNLSPKSSFTFSDTSNGNSSNRQDRCYYVDACKFRNHEILYDRGGLRKS